MAEKILKHNAEHRSGTGQGKVKARAGCPCFSPQGYLNKASCSHSTVLKFHTIVSFSSESISSGDSLSVVTMRQNPGKTEIEAATWPLWRVRMAHNPEVTHPLWPKLWLAAQPSITPSFLTGFFSGRALFCDNLDLRGWFSNLNKYPKILWRKI